MKELIEMCHSKGFFIDDLRNDKGIWEFAFNTIHGKKWFPMAMAPINIEKFFKSYKNLGGDLP